MAIVQHNLNACGDSVRTATRLVAVNAELVRQQSGQPCGVPGDHANAWLDGDVLLHLGLQGSTGGDMVCALNASEALDLAKQLIDCASGHLKCGSER